MVAPNAAKPGSLSLGKTMVITLWIIAKAFLLVLLVRGTTARFIYNGF